MPLTRKINIKSPFDYLFGDLLGFLNLNPAINHVTVINEAPSSLLQDEQKLAIIAQRLEERLAYAIDPPPTIDYQFNSAVLVAYMPRVQYQHSSAAIPEQAPSDLHTLLASIDFYGCADTPAGKQRIIADILAFLAQAVTVKRIVVMIGSLRQTLACDYYNARMNAGHHNGRLLSCHELGTDFMQALRDALEPLQRTRAPICVEFNPLMMGDVLNRFAVGTTYAEIGRFYSELQPDEVLTSFLVPSQLPSSPASVDLLCRGDADVIQAFEWLDTSKFSTLVVQMHYAVRQYASEPGKQMHVRFYDDREDILTPLHAYLSNSKTIPEQITFDCVINDGESYEQSRVYMPIIGTATAVDHQSLLFTFIDDPRAKSCLISAQATLSALPHQQGLGYQAYSYNEEDDDEIVAINYPTTQPMVSQASCAFFVENMLLSKNSVSDQAAVQDNSIFRS